METISYEFLIKQEAELNSKLKAVRDYLNAFYPDYSSKLNNSSQVGTLNLIPANNQIQEQTTKSNNQKSNKPPATIPEKVIYALRELGKGKSKDIADKLTNLFPEYSNNHEKAIRDARLYVSALAIKGIIDVIEKGEGKSGSTYKVKEEDYII